MSDRADPHRYDAGAALETEHNLLFGVLALQLDVIDNDQFAEACTLLSLRRTRSLADLLLERGWITAEDRDLVDQAVRRKLKKVGGDVRAGLGEAATSAVREQIRQVGDQEISHTIDHLPPAPDVVPQLPEAAVRRSVESRYSYGAGEEPIEGGLGRIFRARDEWLHRTVALKMIKPRNAMHPAARARLEREAQINGQLEHPNIVPVHDVGRLPQDDQPFYVMKLVRGRTLKAEIDAYHAARRDGAFDATRRRTLLTVLINVCNALAYAHSRGVVHCDLKPLNIMLGDFGEVYVLDWGLAKVLEAAEPTGRAARVTLSPGAPPDSPSSSQRRGSPLYMAPEQAEGQLDRIDTRTDVYGLGALLFEVLVGRPPHPREPGEDLDAHCRRIAAQETPHARALEPSAPEALAEICARAMARDPNDRYAGASDLARAIQRWLADEPLAAYRAAVAHYEQMVHDHPGRPKQILELARNRIKLALVLSGMDRNPEAEQELRTAVVHYEALVAHSPQAATYRAELAACRVHLHQVLLALGRKAEAAQAQDAAQADYEHLIRSAPADEHHRADFAAALSRIGLPPAEVERRLAELPTAEGSSLGEGPEEEVPGPDWAALFDILVVRLGLIDLDRFLDACDALPARGEQSLVDLLEERGWIAAAARPQIDHLLGVSPPAPIPGRDRAPAGRPLPPPPPPEPRDAAPLGFPDIRPHEDEEGHETLDPGPYQDEPRSAGRAITPGFRFPILHPHGKGALGQVSVALDAELPREVALKEIQERHADDPHSRARFVREAEITGTLEHPGIVPVYSLGSHADGRPFYAMRFIRGESLKDTIRHAASANAPGQRDAVLRELLGRFRVVCDAIAYAHSRGVLHRDLKPGNIMLGPFGETVVIDWGLAKVFNREDRQGAAAPREGSPGSEAIEKGGVIGTPAYMSPEQAAGRADLVGPPSDVYSLGAILYEILTGRAPFGGTDVGTILEAVQRGDYAPPRRLEPRVSPALEAICLKAMALKPQDRYASPRDLADDLDRWLADEPISVYPETALRRLVRRLRHARA